jgi:hypothetical protein
MAWDANSPYGGIGKNRLYKLRDLLRNNINTLNQTLSADPFIAPILASEFGTEVLEGHIGIGELLTSWQPTNTNRAKGGAIRIRVAGTDFKGMSQDFSQRRMQIPDTASSGSGIELSVKTSIFVYFHPDCFNDTDVDVQSERMEVATQTVADWLRAGVFATRAASQLVLDTTEYNSSTTDSLGWCIITAGYLGAWRVGFADGTWVHGIHFLHEAKIGG